MKLKALLLSMATLLLAAACTKTIPVPAATTATPAPPCPAQPQGYMPFPADVVPSLAYHLRDDRIYVHASGISRRRVTLEFLDAEGASALASLTESMIKGGFKASQQKQLDQGRISVALSKKGLRGVAHLTLNPSVGPKPRNPLAKGVLTLDYPLPGQAVPTPVMAPAPNAAEAAPTDPSL